MYQRQCYHYWYYPLIHIDIFLFQDSEKMRKEEIFLEKYDTIEEIPKQKHERSYHRR